MWRVWTKNGRPLSCEKNDVYGPSGATVGQIEGDRVFGPDGAYVGSLVGDRLVYRSYDTEGPIRPYARKASDQGPRRVMPLRTWGDEPKIPD